MGARCEHESLFAQRIKFTFHKAPPLADASGEPANAYSVGGLRAGCAATDRWRVDIGRKVAASAPSRPLLTRRTCLASDSAPSRVDINRLCLAYYEADNGGINSQMHWQPMCGNLQAHILHRHVWRLVVTSCERVFEPSCNRAPRPQAATI